MWLLLLLATIKAIIHLMTEGTVSLKELWSSQHAKFLEVADAGAWVLGPLHCGAPVVGGAVRTRGAQRTEPTPRGVRPPSGFQANLHTPDRHRWVPSVIHLVLKAQA